MVKLQPLFQNCYNEIIVSEKAGEKPGEKSALVLFHGYPCTTPPTESKNRDLAQIIAKEIPVDCYILHYEGLGKSPGEFYFSKSIKDGTDFLSHVKNLGYKNVYVFGHSWGGCVAINAGSVHPEIPLKTIIASPYTIIPEGERLWKSVNNLMAETHDSVPHFTKDTMNADLMIVHNQFNPYTVLEKSALKNIFIVQSEMDDEIPAEMNRQFTEKYKSRVTEYVEWDCDHRFAEAREKLVHYIVKVISSNL
jgi:esterase/lipase